MQVSERFKELATDCGRKVYCKIEAGGEVFYDDKLIEFSFDDIAHPDWFTVGTACANRFHFIVRYNGRISVGSEVRPYISFDNEEWCPLGIFYVSRRYVRGEYINITSYDILYSLDMKYEYAGPLPSDSASLLAEICGKAGISAESFGDSFTVNSVPDDCTVRDMIGYIAALNCACAKINRNGSLVLKKCSGAGEAISAENCMEIQHNYEKSEITAVSAETEGETLEMGKGTELQTVELYNPLITEAMLNRLFTELNGFSFYGAELEMQGLPYLEAGDSATFNFGGKNYPIVISEIEYSYNGGLSARLYSRNKTYLDAVVREDDLESALEQLKQALKAMAVRYMNSEEITLSTEPQIIADFSFDTVTGAFAELNLNFSAAAGSAGNVEFFIYSNGRVSGRKTVSSASANSLASLYHLETGLPKGKNRIYIAAKTNTGTLVIAPSALFAGLVVHRAQNVQTSDIRDSEKLFERFGLINAEFLTAGIAAVTAETEVTKI